MTERDFLLHLAQRNPDIRRELWRLRQRAYLSAGVPDRRAVAERARRVRVTELRFPGDGLLFSALMAFFVTAAGLAAFKLVFPGAFAHSAWAGAPFDVVALGGAVATFLLARTRDRLSVKPVEPPDAEAEEPLLELQDLAERSAHRLEQGYRAHLTLAVAVTALLCGLIGWAGVIALAGHPRFGVLLGLSALLTLSLVGLNWRPFGRAREVRSLAGEASVAAARLGLKVAKLQRIPEAEHRLHAQWRHVAHTLVGLERPST